MKNYIFILFFLYNAVCHAQINTLCSEQLSYIKIENAEDVPSVSNNADGTITLTHPNQDITDIFSNYVIYDFFQSFPSANPNGELFKYYSIMHGSKGLINAIFNNVSPSTFFVEEYTFTSIDPNLIALLDNKAYKLKSYCSNIPEMGEFCEDNEVIVSNDFDLKIAFNYDADSDMIKAETVGFSPCNNSFSIGLRGGFIDGSGSVANKVQLWESDLGISNESSYGSACLYPEEMLYGLLDIGCMEGRNYGNLLIYEGENPGDIVLERENTVFSTDFMTFEEYTLSNEDSTFELVKLFKDPKTSYLQISNSQNKSLTIKILSVTGQVVLKERPFENNSILLSSFTNGIYFIKVKTSNNQQKIYKFLNF